MILEIWYILAAILMVLEVVFGFTVVLLFAALAAFSLGVMIDYGVIYHDDWVMSLAYFFGFTIFWSLVAFKPLRNLLNKSAGGANYSNIIGSKAIVAKGGLQKGHRGEVTWSGSFFKAEIAENSEHDSIVAGGLVKIVAVEENVFIVDVMK